MKLGFNFSTMLWTTVLIAVLKAGHAIDISWVWVFTPIYLWLAVFCSLLLVAGLVAVCVAKLGEKLNVLKK